MGRKHPAPRGTLTDGVAASGRAKRQTTEAHPYVCVDADCTQSPELCEHDQQRLPHGHERQLLDGRVPLLALAADGIGGARNPGNRSVCNRGRHDAVSVLAGVPLQFFLSNQTIARRVRGRRRFVILSRV